FLAHRLHDCANRVHGLAYREGHWSSLDQTIAARGGNEVGNGRTESERGAVNQPELSLPYGIRHRSLPVPQGVNQEEDRAEGGANVVRDRDHRVSAVGS